MIFNRKLKIELQQLRDEFEQYKYDQSNLPKYKESQLLENGTIIIEVKRLNFPRSRYILPLFGTIHFVGVQKYEWIYKGFCEGKIVYVN